MKNKLDYAKAIRVLRAERNVSRDQLAKKACISYSYLSEIEKSIKRPSTDILSRIATAFDMRPSAFMVEIESISDQTNQKKSGRSSSTKPSAYIPFESKVERYSVETAPAPMGVQESRSSYGPLDELMDLVGQLSDEDLRVLLDLVKRLSTGRK